MFYTTEESLWDEETYEKVTKELGTQYVVGHGWHVAVEKSKAFCQESVPRWATMVREVAKYVAHTLPEDNLNRCVLGHVDSLVHRIIFVLPDDVKEALDDVSDIMFFITCELPAYVVEEEDGASEVRVVLELLDGLFAKLFKDISAA